MLTIWVEMLTFSMSFGAAGSRSLGSGSCSPSFVGVSPGRLFFFSLDVGGCRRDCDCPGCTYKPRISRHERTTPKSGYARLNLIVFNSRGSEEGAKRSDARARTHVYRCNWFPAKAQRRKGKLAAFLVVSEFEGVSVILCVCSAHSALKRLFQRRDAEDSQRPLRKLAI